ncbi:MAG: hypothetical protein BWY75_00404 [bacterium ADurb.Bin425]|nr:MAG: hypothetical protein BWY75_00404 [bacterium ADurb.Bin425]
MPADLLSAAGTVLVVSVMTPMIMKAIAPKEGAAKAKDGYFKLDYSKGYYAAMYVTMAFFSGISVIAYLHPGKTKPETMVWVLCVFGFFVALSFFTILAMSRGATYYNQDEIKGSDAFGRRRSIKWQDIAAVDYIGWAQGFRISSKSRETIWIFPVMQGFPAFYEMLVQKAHEKGIEAPQEEDR